MPVLPEFKNSCDKCRQHIKARIFFRKVYGLWMYLCPSCWNREERALK